MNKRKVSNGDSKSPAKRTQTNLFSDGGSGTVGPHRIYQGDCLEVLHDMDERSVSLIVSSPPYNIGKKYEVASTYDDYLDGQRRVIHELCRVVKDDGFICWQVGNHVKKAVVMPIDLSVHQFFLERGMRLMLRFVWSFGHGLHCQKRLSGRYETISLYSRSGDLSKIPGPTAYVGGVSEWSSLRLIIPNVKNNHPEKTVHPCQFPIELVERFVLALTPVDGSVMDIYAGVGSAVVAAILHGRTGIGIEIDAGFCEIAIRRIKDARCGVLQKRKIGTLIYEPSDRDSTARFPEVWKDVSNPSLVAERDFPTPCYATQKPASTMDSNFRSELLKNTDLLICCASCSIEDIMSEVRVLKTSASVCFLFDHRVHGFADRDVQILSTGARHGLHLRNRIVSWYKKDSTYTSVLWFTVDDDGFYFDLDSIRIPSKYPGKKSVRTGMLSGNPLGKNPSDVWEDCCGTCPIEIGLGTCHMKRLVRGLCPLGGNVMVFASSSISREYCNVAFCDIKRNSLFYY